MVLTEGYGLCELRDSGLVDDVDQRGGDGVRQQYRGWWIALVVLVLVVLVLSGGMMGPWMMGWPAGPAAREAGGWGWGLPMALGMLMMLAFWGTVIIAIVPTVRAFTGPAVDNTVAREDAALDILKRRFAAASSRESRTRTCAAS